MSNRKLPIWIQDEHGNKYHVKVNSDGLPYIVDAGLNKSLFITNIGACVVGHVIDYPLFYNKYTVIRNDLVEKT